MDVMPRRNSSEGDKLFDGEPCDVRNLAGKWQMGVEPSRMVCEDRSYVLINLKIAREHPRNLAIYGSMYSNDA